MIVIGTDPHKATHTAVAVERATGELRSSETVAAKETGHRALLGWAQALDPERTWAIEDCRHVSGRLERFLIAEGEHVVRVAPKLMAGARRSARERGKSGPDRCRRQVNCALHRVAVTQARIHPEARAYLARKRKEGKSTAEALRCLKRMLVRVVHRLLTKPPTPTSALDSALVLT